jgi:signal peptidase
MEKTLKTKKKKFKIGNIIFWIVLAVVALYSIVALTSTDDSVTTLFGNTAFTVQTNSMAPTFEAGDLIYVDTDYNVEDIKVGDVITYQTLIDVDGDGELELVYNSHRVTSIVVDLDGRFLFVTKGDNNTSGDLDPIHGNYVIGIWTGKPIKNLGGIIDGIVGFLKSGTGFFIFIVLPCFAFLVYEVFKFVNVMADYKSQQTLQSRVKLQEEAVALAKAQIEEETKLKALEAENKK